MSTGKRLLLAVVLAVTGLGAWCVATYPRIGQVVFDAVAPLEARAYGFVTETVPVSDTRLVVYRGSRGPARETLVLLHGYSADRQIWPRFGGKLLERYDVIIPDLAGHGDTGFVKGLDYSAPAQARRVIEMLDALHIGRAHVVGNSMGGFIAAHLARSHPERIASATLIDAAGVLSPEPSDMDRELAAGRNPFEVHNREEFTAFYAMTMAQPPWLPGFVLDGMAARYQARREELAEIFRGFHHRDMLDAELGSITVPVLVIWGRLDRLLHVSAAPVWQQGISGARLEVMDDLGHMPMVEAPERTAAVVADFLDTLRPR